MTDYAGVRPLMDMQDVAAKYAGLETKVGGIEKTVDNLSRSMADLSSGLRHEMATQTHGIMTSIEKLTSAAGEGNRSLRSEFTADIKTLADRQGIKSNTLIACCTLGLAAIAFFVAQKDKPTDEKFAKIETSIAQYVPREQIDKMQAQIDKQGAQIVPREEHDREQRLRDKIAELQDKITDQIRTRTIQRLDDQDSRLRAVEQKTVK